jgi:predicted DNA-binding transcriptional regulator AlpA
VQQDTETTERFNNLESKLDKVLQLLNNSSLIGDWIQEKDLIKKIGLGRTTLYKLTLNKELSCSKLVEGKGRWYRLSEIEELLYKQQKERKTK